MKNILLLLCLVSFLSISSIAQIYEPEGLNMPGSYNGWVNPPTINSIAGIQKTGGTLLPITDGARRYHTIINVQSSGGDFSGGAYEWKFTSGPGPGGSYFDNTWGSVTVSMNDIQTYTWNNGNTNNSVTLTNGRYYTINWRDQGYAFTDAIWMETSSAPTTFYGVTLNFTANGSPATVNITLNSTKAAEENIYVRYTTDDFSTWGVVQASGSGTSYSATIPGAAVTSTSNNKYYVFTSTKDLTFLSSASGINIDLSTINLANRSGLNYQLPVELSSFTLNASGKSIKLNWTTATEKNSSGFDIQRSIDQSNWETLTFIKGYNLSNSPKDYTYIDNQVRTGTKYYYRLKQIDNDGSFEYSKVIEVLTGNMLNGFVLDQNYPNPFNPSTTIKFGFENQTKAQVKIYDALGNEVAELFNGTADAGRIYDVSFNALGLSSGVYFYKLISDNKTDIKKMLFMK